MTTSPIQLHRRMVMARGRCGGVLLLAEGDRVPADARQLDATDLHVDESLLTGESVPVEKALAPVAADAALGDRLGLQRVVGDIVLPTDAGRLRARLHALDAVRGG